MSYTVRQRTHEIGVRMALGANASDVLGWTVSRGMLLTAAGALIGLASAFVLTRFMESLLFGVARADALTFVLGPTVLAGGGATRELSPRPPRCQGRSRDCASSRIGWQYLSGRLMLTPAMRTQTTAQWVLAISKRMVPSS